MNKLTEEAKTESVRIQWEMEEARKSSFHRYTDLIIGKKGFLNFLLYELIILFSSWVPGALGLFLRAKLYPLLLKQCGRGVVFGTNVILRHPHKIVIGDGTIIDDNVLLDAKGQDNEGIIIGRNCFIGRNTILSCKNGDIVLGDRVNIGFNCEIFSGSKVSIGADTMLAAYCYLIGGDHVADDPEKPITQTGSISRGINIGHSCWLGADVKVLDGITIHNNTIIGAGAVVTKDIEAFKIALGIPAKVIKDRRENVSS